MLSGGKIICCYTEDQLQKYKERSRKLVEKNTTEISDEKLKDYYIILSSDKNSILNFDQRVIVFSDYEKAERFAALSRNYNINYSFDLLIVLPYNLYLKVVPYKRFLLGDNLTIRTILKDFKATEVILEEE